MTSQKTIYSVDGKPFIAIAGEVHNSNSSSPAYMEQVWDKAQQLGMNTLLLPVTWEMTEPEEGCFDFSVPDALIAQARAREMRIIFLWFGSWKNAQCMYAPEWVKTDLERFPRAQVEKGKNKVRLKMFYGMSYSTLSYFGKETLRCDSRAFAALMAHIREVDKAEHTVIGMQVENETGLMGAAREHSEEADRIFAGPVPQAFADYMHTHTDTMEPEIKACVEAGSSSGSWEEVFGTCAEEIFTAYYTASYVNTVAEAGKAEYDLPYSANCWLDKGEMPGKYPTGGPVAKVMEVWHYAAPAIEALAPDIYVKNYHEICEQYQKAGNPLVIPETAVHSYAAPRLVYTIGHYHAACFSPFGFEDMGLPFNSTQGMLFGMDTTDPLLKTPQNVEEYGKVAGMLCGMMPLLASRYGTRNLQAVISEKTDMTAPFDPAAIARGKMDPNTVMVFDEIGFMTLMNVPMITRKDGCCLICKEDANTYYILANGCMLNIFSTNPLKPNCDLLRVEEGTFENGNWVAGRVLNGDETASLTFNEYTLLKVRAFTYA